jgi:transcriptional regulator with XRE-family HTH domain
MQLGSFLKQLRTRIDPETMMLGPHFRLSSRRGHLVSQEELAESIGVSRVWYSKLEAGLATRPSPALLSRLSAALMLNSEEQKVLFALALPELGSILSETTSAVVEAFDSIRRLSRRLWVASTEAEALAVAREHAVSLFGPDAMQTLTRVGEGRWERISTGGGPLVQRYDDQVLERWSGASVDDLCCYGLMTRAGEVTTRSERDTRLPDLAANESRILTEIRLPDLSFAMTSVRSKRGFEARILAVHWAGHSFSEIERAELSALGEITSLALSG